MSLDVSLVADIKENVFSYNITHNLNDMAEEAGIYMHLWRPNEIGITHAIDLIQPLENGLALLKLDKARFEKFNPTNGWGVYEDLITFVSKYCDACKANPAAEISVDR